MKDVKSEQLPDYYIGHDEDGVACHAGNEFEGSIRYTPHAKLKEAEERISCLESRLLLSDSNATWLQKEIERLKEFEYMYLANRSINHE